MPFTPNRSLRLWLGLGGLLFGSTLVPAAVYDLALNDVRGRSLRLNIPDTLPEVRGILIYGNGANGDSRGGATNTELVRLAESLGFAVIGTAYWYNFSAQFDPQEFAAFETSLQQLATLSNHPEIVIVPWIPIGHSNGGQMSYGFNTLRPSKVISVVVSKGAYYNSTRPGPEALQTPALLIAGEIDPGLGTASIRDLFFGNRPRGALWAWLEDQGVNHSRGNSDELTLPFIEAMYRARYPVTDALPVPLIPLREVDGWLTDPDSYKITLATIAPRAHYAGDKTTAGWLPDRRLAYLFRAFASYNKASATATLSTGIGPIDWGTAVTYTIGEPTAIWTTIDFYEGDALVGQQTPASISALSVTHTPTRPGYAVYHAVVTFADGTRHSTIPRRVFVQAGPASEPLATDLTTLPAIATAGGAATFSISIGGSPLPTLRWQRLPAGAATWENLDESATYSGVTTTTLTVFAPTLAMTGAQFRCVLTNSAGTTTSASSTLTVTSSSSSSSSSSSFSSSSSSGSSSSSSSGSGSSGGGGGDALGPWITALLIVLVARRQRGR